MRRNNLDIQRIEVKEMTENARKVFDLLGVEPNERFKLERDATNAIYYITEDLKFILKNESGEFNFDDCFRLLLTNKIGNIVKLPKESKKKKLRDLTKEEWDKWLCKNCKSKSIDCKKCKKCVFDKVACTSSYLSCSWVSHKDLYSDKFLNQEIEV